jgi:hypothetical protein
MIHFRSPLDGRCHGYRWRQRQQAPSEAKPLELVLFHVNECYVYLVHLLSPLPCF